MALKNKTGVTEKRKKISNRELELLIKPMLAKSGVVPAKTRDYFYEYKWDGYRCITSIIDSKVNMYSRNGKLFNSTYPKIFNELSHVIDDVIIDGEIVAVDKNKIPQFQLLQNSGKGATEIQYHLFDIIYLNGSVITSLPFSSRVELLHHFYEKYDFGSIFVSKIMTGDWQKLLQTATNKKMEGLVAKRADGKYYPGTRTSEWIKLKAENTQSAIICGYTEPQGSRNKFGSLILGIYAGNHLVFIGHCGTGFSDSTLHTLYKKMQPLVRKNCPFETIPPVNQAVTWLKPELICEIKFTEWTQEGILRHPAFKGLRNDLQIEKVNREPQR